jgi:hypothetical protein
MRNYAEAEGHLRSDLGISGTVESSYLSDMSIHDAFAKSLADSFLKKLCPLGDTSKADEAALKKFKAINSKLPTGPFGFSADNEAESCFWDYFRSNFNRCLGFDVGDRNMDLDWIRDHMDVGPGASQKADATSAVSKLFMGELSYSTTDYLLTLYRSALMETGFWAEAEMRRFKKFGVTKVKGGKLFFAKKNAEISRTCCTEPTVNMLLQKALGAFVEYRLEKHFGINLSVQPDNNRELVRVGSLDGSFGSIDLVSASDSIGLSLFNAIMEEGFTKALFQMSRCESAVLPDGSEVELRMISTMGNGFTFPLQTVIFASAVKAVYQLMGLPCSSPASHFGVFGDDIVVRREAYPFLCKMLEKLDFQVNVGKSFNTGPFRESCGHDYYTGVNIRGVYIRSLETPQEVCSAINRLNRWSALSGIRLPRLQRWLLNLVPKAPRVPPSEADEAGIHVPFYLTFPKVSSRYWFKYRYYRKIQRKIEMPEPDDSQCPEGIAFGFLKGHLKRNDVPIDSRRIDTDRCHQWPSLSGEREVTPAFVVPREGDHDNDVKRYKVARSEIPYWDYLGRRSGWNATSFDAWKSVVTDIYMVM